MTDAYFQVWAADPSSTPSNTITLTNKSYNGRQVAGNTLTINFIAGYSGKKPEVASITFNNTPLCSGVTNAPATSSAPVTTAAPVTTSGPEPTTDDGGSKNCASIQPTNEWSGNFQANLIVQIPFNTNAWSIKLTFSRVVTQFRVS